MIRSNYKKAILLLLLISRLIFSPKLFAQNIAINTTGNTPDASAMLDVVSTTQGFLMPRMTTVQRIAIATPATGLQVYDTNTNTAWYFNGSIWINTASSGGTVTNVTGNAPISIATGTSTPAISIATANTTTAGAISSTDWNTFNNKQTAITLTTTGNSGLSSLTAGALNIPAYTLAGLGGTSSTLNSGNILVGNASNVATPVTMSGDATISNTGALTIDTGAVTSAKILDGTVANVDLSTGTGGIYKGSGSLSGATTVTQAANTLAFTSTAVNGFSVAGTSLSVDGANNRVGIGTAAPGYNLDVNGTARVATLPAYTANLYGTDAFVVPDQTTGQLKQFDFNQSGCPVCTIQENATTHVVPNGVTHYYDANANYTGTVVLPAAGRYVGDMFIFQHGAQLSTTILTTNTTMAASLLIATPFVGGASFVWNGTAWMLTSNNTGNIYTSDGTLVGNRTVTGGANTLAFTSTVVNGFSVAGTSLSVDGANNRVGIGNATPAQALDVTGNVKFSGALMPNNLPGTAGQVLTSTGAGTAPVWASGTPQVLVAATRTSSYTPTVAYANLIYNSASINVGTAYNITTGTFTAPATGTYEFIVNNIYSAGNSLNNAVSGRVVINSVTDMETAVSITPYASPAISTTLRINDIVAMTSGQTASITLGGLVNTMTPVVGTAQHVLKIIRLD